MLLQRKEFSISRNLKSIRFTCRDFRLWKMASCTPSSSIILLSLLLVWHPQGDTTIVGLVGSNIPWMGEDRQKASSNNRFRKQPACLCVLWYDILCEWRYFKINSMQRKQTLDTHTQSHLLTLVPTHKENIEFTQILSALQTLMFIIYFAIASEPNEERGRE